MNSGSGSVTPVDLVTRKAGGRSAWERGPKAIALTPAADRIRGQQRLRRRHSDRRRDAHRGGADRGGADPEAIALTPDGRTAFVVNSGSDTVTPIDVASRARGAPIAVGSEPRRIALTRDGRTAYVLNWGGGVGHPDRHRDRARGAADPGRQLSVRDRVRPRRLDRIRRELRLGQRHADRRRDRPRGSPIPVGAAPDALAVTPDGTTVEVVSGDDDAVTPIAVATRQAGRPIRGRLLARRGGDPRRDRLRGEHDLGHAHPRSRAATRGTRSRSASPRYPSASRSVPAAMPAVVLDTYSGQVTLVDTRARRALGRVKVGRYPIAVAIAP